MAGASSRQGDWWRRRAGERGLSTPPWFWGPFSQAMPPSHPRGRADVLTTMDPLPSPTLTRPHLALAVLFCLLVPALSWLDGTGFLAWTMYSGTGTYRLRITAFPPSGAPRLVAPTELARRVGRDEVPFVHRRRVVAPRRVPLDPPPPPRRRRGARVPWPRRPRGRGDPRRTPHPGRPGPLHLGARELRRRPPVTPLAGLRAGVRHLPQPPRLIPV